MVEGFGSVPVMKMTLGVTSVRRSIANGAGRTMLLSAVFSCLMFAGNPASARDVHIKLPKRSKPTPVQSLNQKGVDALKKHDYAKAKKLFYKAYLLDPDNPFTLNNLGYIAELEGQVDRAQRFYDLSTAMNSEALVEKSTDPSVKGKPVTLVAGHTDKGPMEVNKLNVQAIGFLAKDRPFEAEHFLNDALKLDPKNPFTLNNLGYDMEMQGELQKAQEYYRQAAAENSDEKVIVALRRDWRGKPISEIAAANANKVSKAMKTYDSPEAQVALLNLRGVSALNRNDPTTARRFFEEAYKKDPHNAFALNNMGYLSEQDGDRETAQFFYAKAQDAERADQRVTLSSRPQLEGRRLEQVAQLGDNLVDARMQADLREKRAHSTGIQGVELASRGYSKPAPEVPDADESTAAAAEEGMIASPAGAAPSAGGASSDGASGGGGSGTETGTATALPQSDQPAPQNSTPATGQPQAPQQQPAANAQPATQAPAPAPIIEEKDPVPAPR